MARRKKPTTAIGKRIARQREARAIRRGGVAAAPTQKFATTQTRGVTTAQAKITFTNTQTGITTTRFVPIKVTTIGGSGRSRERLQQQAIINKIDQIQAKQERADRQARNKFLDDEARRKIREAQAKVQADLDKKKSIKEAQAKQRAKVLLTAEQLKRKKILGQDVTELGEIKGILGTRAERQRASALNELNKLVQKKELERVAKEINSITNKINQQQTITRAEAIQLDKIIIKRGNELPGKQLKTLKSLPGSIGAGIIDFGKTLKDVAVVSVKGSVSFGRRLKREADKQGVSIKKVIAQDILKGVKTGGQVANFVIKNPGATAIIVGAAASEVSAEATKSFNKDPVRFGTRTILELFPNIAIKGVKSVARVSSGVLRAANRIAFSPNKAVSIANRIAELEKVKGKTRFDLEELKILKEQLKVDQKLKFATVGLDDISKVPDQAKKPFQDAQKGIPKTKRPTTGEKEIKKLIDTQKKLTDKQKAKQFRKAKAKGAPLTAETQAKKLSELFDKGTPAINKQSTIKITNPEVLKFNILDRNVNKLSQNIKDLNKLLKSGVTDAAANRIKRQKDIILKQISRFESLSSTSKSKLLKATNFKQKQEILRNIDRANIEIERLSSVRDLEVVLSKLDTRLGVDKTGFIERTIKSGNVDRKELAEIVSSNFVKALDLRTQALKSFGKSKAEINTLISRIKKILNAGSFKPTIKQKQRIIRIGKGQVFTAKTRKIPTILKKEFKKNADLKGIPLDVIVLSDLVRAKQLRIAEILQGQRKTSISKVDLDKILFSDTFKSKAIRKLKQLDQDIQKLKGVVRFLKASTLDKSLPKRVRVLSLQEQGKNINLIRALEKDKIRISEALKKGVKPVDQLQTAQRQKLFAAKLKEQIERGGRQREIKVTPTKSTNTDLVLKVNLPGGYQMEVLFNFPKLPQRAPLKVSKRASLGSLTKSQKPVVKVKFSKRTSIEKLAPQSFQKNLEKSIVNNPVFKTNTKRISILKQQRREFQSFAKQVKDKKLKTKIDTELKNINKLEQRLNNALRLAVAAIILNRVASFIKSQTKTKLDLKPITKIDLALKQKLTPIQKLKELVKEINQDLGVVEVIKPTKPKPKKGVSPKKVTKLPTTKAAKLRPIKKKKITPKKPIKEKPPKKPVKIKLDFDTKLPSGTRLKFNIKFRERRNASIPFNRFTNPVVVKTRELGLPLNKAIKKGFGAIDKTTQASAQLFISGITKVKDIEKPTALLKKFGISKSKVALRFVEKNKNRIDTSGEKRGLLLSKLLKKKTKPKKKPSKKRKKK